MHELSLCESILATALREYGRLDPPPVRLERVRVVAGAMHQIVPEYLHNAWRALRTGTAAESASLELRKLGVTARCPACSWEGPVEPPVFACGRCETYGVDVLTGREFYIESMEVEDDEHT